MAWTTIATPDEGVFVAVASADYIYLLVDSGGEFFRYDVNADDYTSLGFYPGGAGGEFTRAIHDPSDDTIWLFGKGETWQYDIGDDTWNAFTDDPNVISRTSFACARIGRKVICAGGYDDGNTTDVVTSYDLDTDTWTLKTALPAELAECSGAAVGTELFVYGGSDVGFNYIVAAYVYDSVGNSWVALTGEPYDTDFSGAPTAAALSTGIVFVEGGSGDGPSDKTWLHDTGLDSWAAGDDTPFDNYKQSAELDDVVYVFSSLLGDPAAARFGTPSPPEPWSGLSEIEAELVDLSDLTTPLAALTLTRDRSWQEQLNDAGSGELTFQNDDPSLALVSLPNTLVNLSVRGVPAVTLLLASFVAQDIAPGEEAEQTTVYRGPLHLGLLDRSPIYPSNGVGRKPVERDRAFNWMAPSYDDSGWATATVVTDAANAQTNWDAGDADSQFDPDFPDAASAGVLWASDGTVASAGVGDCYFRQEFTVTNTGTHTISALIDNYGEVSIDGQVVMTPGQEADLVVGFKRTSTYVAELTAGAHLIAVKATNGLGTGSNPAGVAYNIHESNSTGALGTLIASSDASAKIVEYAIPDGMPMGQVINLLIAEAQARGELPYLTVSFTDTLDTDGATWPLLLDVATKVGTTLLGAMREWSDTYIDFYMAPATTELDMWIKGTRGTDVSATVSYHAPTDPLDETTGNLLSLTRTGEAAIANDFLVDSAVGWSRQTDAVAVAVDGNLGAYLSLGALGAPAEVARVADGQLDLFGVTRVQTDIVIAPRTDAETPYVGYAGTGDTIEVESADHRVLSMTVAENNDNGIAMFVPTLNDTLVLNAEERFAQAIRKMIPGSLGGRSKPAQPTLPQYVPRGGRATALEFLTIVETFNQTDSTTIGPLLVWEKLATRFGYLTDSGKTIGNVLTVFDTTVAGTYLTYLRSRTSLGTRLMTVEATVTARPTIGVGAGQRVAARLSLLAGLPDRVAADDDCVDGIEFTVVGVTGTTYSPQLVERQDPSVANTFAAGTNFTLAPGDVMRVEVEAGVVTGYINGTPVVSGTPTFTFSDTVNVYAGVCIFDDPNTTGTNGSTAMDNWSATDTPP